MQKINEYMRVPRLSEVRAATPTGYFLAEGPGWDRTRQRVYWVDVMDGLIFSGALNDDLQIIDIEQSRIPGTASAVAPAAGGGYIVAGTRSLHRVTADGRLIEGKELISGDERRFNDGKPDPMGRFVVGTKGREGSSDELLLRMVDDGCPEVIDDDLTLSNGLAWSVDGHLMYSIDTFSRRIFERDYDPNTGVTGERRLLLTIEQGYPDGMTIDADGHLWIAVWGGGCVLRATPQGAIIGRIEVPAPHVSSISFVGSGLETLLITTAKENLSDAQLAENPESGKLFTANPGVAGIPSALAKIPKPLCADQKGN